MNTFTTYVDGNPVYAGDSLESAARAWDAATYNAGGVVAGGISIQARDGAGNMTRDGWILHVRENGTVYLHPGLNATS